MDRANKLLGDASARMSVSMDISTKDFGNGSGVMVSVSISCGQQDRTLTKAYELCKELSQEYAVDAFQEAQEIFKEQDIPYNDKKR